MPFRLTNRAKQLLIVPLNSGESLHLAPGETSDPVEDYELQRNEKVDKLLSMNLLTSEAADEPQASAPAPVALLPASTAETDVPRRTSTRPGNRRT